MIRGGRKIRPPRTGRSAVANDVDSFEASWKILSSSFREIHTKNASHLSYEELYRHAYRIILTKKGELLYRRVQEYEQYWLSTEVQPVIRDLLTPNLLRSAAGSAEGTSANERRTAGERFLKGLKLAWQDHQLCVSMLADVLMYLNRAYCQDNRQPFVQAVSMALFRDSVLRSNASQQHQHLTILKLLNYITLDQIRMEREGDVIDKNLIKSCVYMLEGLFETFQEADEDRLYATSFEEDFLAASREFYKAEGDFMLRDADAGTYCRHAWTRMSEERDRCRSTLSESTIPKIEKVVLDELVKSKIKELIEMDSGAKHMVDHDRFEELKLVYELNSRVDDSKAELVRAIQKRILELGDDINRDIAVAAQVRTAPPTDGSGDKAKSPAEKNVNQLTTSAIKWVEEVLALKDKFDAIWIRSFDSDKAVHTSLTRSFAEFVNNCARSAEYISLFIDDNMKKGIKGKTESEIDAVLDKAITLLRYVQDKDYFERYYKKHLCKRLLYNKSLSNDVEKQMISRLKIELGNTFTGKLEAMFKDMTISEELASGFKTHVASLGDPDPKRIELGINVLTSMTWPLDSVDTSADGQGGGRLKCIYPTSIDRIKRGFEDFYAQKHTGRRLTWVPRLGTADIRASFPKVPVKDGFKERRHELNVPTYSMIILLLYNDMESGQSLSFEEIQAKTNIPTDDLIRNLQSLAVSPKTRVLLKQPMSKDVKPTDRFIFNEGFVGKFFKIKIGLVTGNKVEGDKERKETEKKNDDTRSFVIEAGVVRIMKQRKELKHSELVSETINQLASQFKPEIVMVKKRIEALIEREYLERIEESNPPAYRYLA